jgi:hypothetical protein
MNFENPKEFKRSCRDTRSFSIVQDLEQEYALGNKK